MIHIIDIWMFLLLILDVYVECLGNLKTPIDASTL
jgi:hypothetical protein